MLKIASLVLVISITFVSARLNPNALNQYSPNFFLATWTASSPHLSGCCVPKGKAEFVNKDGTSMQIKADQWDGDLCKNLPGFEKKMLNLPFPFTSSYSAIYSDMTSSHKMFKNPENVYFFLREIQTMNYAHNNSQLLSFKMTMDFEFIYDPVYKGVNCDVTFLRAVDAPPVNNKPNIVTKAKDKFNEVKNTVSNKFNKWFKKDKK